MVYLAKICTDMNDNSRWAKKFDTVAHLYAEEHGTVCGSVAHCLGNNYATKEMETCKECLRIKPILEFINELGK